MSRTNKLDSHAPDHGREPLYHATPEFLKIHDVEIIVSLSGIDVTLSQTIHSRYSYIADEILCGYRFKDIMRRTEDNQTEINYELFHEVEK